MPAGSLLALFDDIATILDDVSLITQMAAKNTAGVLADDFASTLSKWQAFLLSTSYQ